jgi:surface protein
MEGMFKEASSFNYKLENWDTSQVQNMNSMFEEAKSFRNHDLRPWNVDKVGSLSRNNFMKNAGGGNTEPIWK